MSEIECFLFEYHPDLLGEAQRVETRGGVTAISTFELFNRHFPDGQGVAGNSFRVAGAKLTGCVLGTAQFLLLYGARQVTIELTKCLDETELTWLPKHLSLLARKELFQGQLPKALRNDPRIVYSWEKTTE